MKALLLSFLLATSALASPGENLPNDCVLIATEAFIRLSPTVEWVKVVEIRFLEPPDLPGGIPRVRGHCFAVWQITKDGPVCVYDSHGTMILKTRSHELAPVMRELNRLNPTYPIIAAHFVE